MSRISKISCKDKKKAQRRNGIKAQRRRGEAAKRHCGVGEKVAKRSLQLRLI